MFLKASSTELRNDTDHVFSIYQENVHMTIDGAGQVTAPMNLKPVVDVLQDLSSSVMTMQRVVSVRMCLNMYGLVI